MQDTMKKILIVDDSAASLAAMTAVLSGSYRVFPVNSGATALKVLEKQRPDLILLDVEMPEISGIDLIKIIKSDENLSDIPVIFLTALNDAASKTQGLKLGAADYIHKPVNAEALKSKVGLHLGIEA